MIYLIMLVVPAIAALVFGTKRVSHLRLLKSKPGLITNIFKRIYYRLGCSGGRRLPLIPLSLPLKHRAGLCDYDVMTITTPRWTLMTFSIYPLY